MAKASDNVYPKVILSEGAAPSTPSSAQVKLYAKADGLLYSKDDAGAETLVSGGAGGGAPTTTPYVTTATDAGLSAEIVIPGLAVTDRRVGGTDDDEFDQNTGSTPSGWTNVGTPSTIDTNTLASHLHLKANASASVSWKGIYKTAPSMPFTVVSHIRAHTIERKSSPTSGLQCLMAVHASAATPGALCMGLVYWDTGTNSMHFGLYKNTGPTGANTLLGSEVTTKTDIVPEHLYLRLVVTSSSSVAYDWSPDGIFWHSVATGQNSGTTIASAGLIVDSENASFASEAYFDWIRFS